jgi:SAM-dependent methyltransferase
MPTSSEILTRKREFERRHGRWESDNIELGDGVYTLGPEVAGGPAARVPATLQLARDALGVPFEGLRALDLGAAEGIFAIELARQGASVVAVEGRRPGIERARFAKELLGLTQLELVHGDVRELDRQRHGSFDLVLCLGILYHLPAPDLFRFVHELARVTERVAVIDTHVSHAPRQSVASGGQTYWGRHYREHDPASTTQEREAESRASLDNEQSFWLTRPSLYNLLGHAGFTSVLEARLPRAVSIQDRVTLVAYKGERQEPLCVDGAAGFLEWRERETLEHSLVARRVARRVLPEGLRHRLKAARARLPELGWRS